MDYSRSSREKTEGWRETGPLPASLRGIRGAMLDGVFHITGKIKKRKSLYFIGNFSGGFNTETKKASDSVMAWDPIAEVWELVGHLASPRLSTFP